ncbi:hypothetical protein CK203_107175 [Vitis vinifera]|uniref:Uncharacterized protein n=1 Tax=Vitis vinifera TaxID=29760 RepID=A0A438CSY0_VITVI|nr:hypothetical protein CK203_107175 [Vitis vinifera]
MAETLIQFGILGCAEVARKVSRAITLAPMPRCTPSAAVRWRRPRDSPPPTDSLPRLRFTAATRRCWMTPTLTPCTCRCHELALEVGSAGGGEGEACASGEACGSECGGVGSDFGGVRIQWSAVYGRHNVATPPSDG